MPVIFHAGIVLLAVAIGDVFTISAIASQVHLRILNYYNYTVATCILICVDQRNCNYILKMMVLSN